MLVCAVISGATMPAHADKLQGTVGVNIIAPQNRVVLIAMQGDIAPKVEAEDMAFTITRDERVQTNPDTGRPERQVDYTLFY